MPFWRRKTPKDAPPPSRPVAGVIPCAGESTRMGRSKALLDAGGRSFLAATVGALIGGGCDPVVVVVGPGQADEARRAKAAGAVVLENPAPGEGPITSLRLALAVLGNTVEGVAFLPVDHPRVRPETVATLVEALREGEAPLVLPTYEGARGHPALFGRGLFAALADPGLQGGARTVVHAHLDAATLLVVDDPGVVTDIDTPDAYRSVFGREATP
jgi:molybdenum cofactor cytidylyltransferase